MCLNLDLKEGTLPAPGLDEEGEVDLGGKVTKGQLEVDF